MSTIQKPSTALPPSGVQDLGEPAWEVARLFPAQGTWSEQEYLSLSGNRLVEFAGGRIEVLTMPTRKHQLIVRMLFELIRAFVKEHGLGEVVFAPISVRLWEGKFREPDVVFVLASRRDRIHDQYCDGADLVVEVVSDDDRRRDLETKRFEYARAGISEYWIVDPQQREITVLKLSGDRYEVHGLFHSGEKAASLLLPGLTAEVSDVFDGE